MQKFDLRAAQKQITVVEQKYNEAMEYTDSLKLPESVKKEIKEASEAKFIEDQKAVIMAMINGPLTGIKGIQANLPDAVKAMNDLKEDNCGLVVQPITDIDNEVEAAKL
jgi:hypothetical protein